MIYFDTAFLVKLQVEEAGSREILRLVQQRNEVMASSIFAKIETVAAFHRKLREGTLTPPALAGAMNQVARDVETGRLIWFPLSLTIIERIHDTFLKLPAKVFLRAGDAIHLATAAQAGFKEIYSNDRHLLAAAPIFKLKGINPLNFR